MSKPRWGYMHFLFGGTWTDEDDEKYARMMPKIEQCTLAVIFSALGILFILVVSNAK